MTPVLFTALLWLTSLVAGFLGAMTGLGGGVVIVPVLALLFHVDLKYAIGASLISVIATSSAAAAAYVREGYSNIRIGMFLEVATTLGAILGAFLATRMSSSAIGIIFAVVLIYSAYRSFFETKEHLAAPDSAPDSLAGRLELNGSYPVADKQVSYTVHRVPLGFSMMFGAGTLSGLLGIGSGALKVIAMDRAMQIPFIVSTTTSNFMIGVTAAASAGVYLSRGYIHPAIAMPVMLGVLMGALIGTRVLVKSSVKALRRTFAIVVFALAVEMLFSSLTGRL